jgi:hypothetical protein
MVLLILLAAAVALGALLGVLAKMPPKQIAAQCVVMMIGVLVFYSLVNLL